MFGEFNETGVGAMDVMDPEYDSLDSKDLGNPRSVLVYIVYFITWLGLLFPNVLPLGRPAIVTIGAVVCLIGNSIVGYYDSYHFDYVSSFEYVDWDTIFLLIGLMIVNFYLQQMGIIDWLAAQLDAKDPRMRMAKIIGLSTILSPVLMNDTVCLAFGPIVVALAKQPVMEKMNGEPSQLSHRREVSKSVSVSFPDVEGNVSKTLPEEPDMEEDLVSPSTPTHNALPYLMALATSANIGSALTTTGNPQNAVIASLAEGEITFLGFLKYQFVPVMVIQVMNVVHLLIHYRGQLREEIAEFRTASRLHTMREALIPVEDKPIEKPVAKNRNVMLGVMLVVFGMVICFILEIDVDSVALAVGFLLMVLHACMRYYNRGSQIVSEMETESDMALPQLDWGLILLFCSQFMLVSVLVETGAPSELFRLMIGENCVEADDVLSMSCIYKLSAIVAILSNIMSNVPVILILADVLADNPHKDVVWVIVALVATLAGNLCLLGSAANLIVAEQAKSQGDFSMATIPHAKYGLPATILHISVGVFLLTLVMGI